MALPPYESTLQYVYRADEGTFSDLAGTTPATTDGTTVLRWVDAGGGSNYLGHASAGPQLKTNRINGLPSLLFDGSSQFLQFLNRFVNPYRTIYAVVRSSSTVTSTLNCGTAVSLQWRLDNLKMRLVSTGTADIGFATNAMASNTWTQINVSWDRTQGIFRQAGAANGTASLSTGANHACEFFGANSGSSEFFAGDLAVLLEYAGIHDTTHRQAVEAWITGIWGV
jgi:hypothetical protein